MNESDGNPDTLIAAVIDDTPGIGTMPISFLIQSLINPYPGSLIVGVPASEISANCLPLRNKSTIFFISFSLL